MGSIYLSMRLDSEYLEHLGERYALPFDCGDFDWCRLENPETGMRLPSREELDASAAYLLGFLGEIREKLSAEELAKVTVTETALLRWRANAHLLYSRSIDFIVLAVGIFYETSSYLRGPGHRNGQTASIKMLFENLEESLLSILDNGESNTFMKEIIETMDLVLEAFSELEVHMAPDTAEELLRLQGLRDYFEIESLLSSRL